MVGKGHVNLSRVLKGRARVYIVATTIATLLMATGLQVVVNPAGTSKPIAVERVGAGAWGGESQIAFNTYNSKVQAYFTYLKICGYNQNNDYRCWSRSFPGNASYTLYNWWWDLDRGISLSFTLIGYGERRCSISGSYSWFGQPDILYVAYGGNNQCSFY